MSTTAFSTLHSPSSRLGLKLLRSLLSPTSVSSSNSSAKKLLIKRGSYGGGGVWNPFDLRSNLIKPPLSPFSSQTLIADDDSPAASAAAANTNNAENEKENERRFCADKFLSRSQQAETSISIEEEEAICFSGNIPRDKIQKSFSLSSGPGGQNVNKNPTKAEIRFNLHEAEWIPVRLKTRVMEKYHSLVNNKNELVITSMRTREAHQNLEDCYRKLRDALIECSKELIKEVRMLTPTKEDIDILDGRSKKAEFYRRVEKIRLSKKKQFRREARNDFL